MLFILFALQLLLGLPTLVMGTISLSVVLRLGGVAYYMHQTPEVEFSCH